VRTLPDRLATINAGIDPGAVAGHEFPFTNMVTKLRALRAFRSISLNFINIIKILGDYNSFDIELFTYKIIKSYFK